MIYHNDRHIKDELVRVLKWLSTRNEKHLSDIFETFDERLRLLEEKKGPGRPRKTDGTND